MATVFYYDEFEWDDDKAASNRVRHGVTFEEAATVFDDPRALEAPDLLHAGRFVIIGLSTQARVLFVVHAETVQGRIRLISARKASPAQRRMYEKSE